MKKFVYITFMLLLLSSCTSEKLCKKYPDAFIDAYMPYQLNNILKFANNSDTISFKCRDIQLYDDFLLEYSTCGKCAEPSCPPYSIRMEGIDTTYIYSILNYEIMNYKNSMHINIEIAVRYNVDDSRDGFMSENFATTPFDNNVFDVLGDTIKLFDNRNDSQFCQVDIVRNKGIFAFYEKLGNGDTIKWELVE